MDGKSIRGLPPGVIAAVQLRAQGYAWEACASAAGWTVAELHTWVHHHQRLWYRELFRARRDIRDGACDEAVSMLRTKLRKGDDDLVLRAANSLASNFSGKRSGTSRQVKPTSDNEQFRQMVEAIPEGVTSRVDLHLQAAAEEAKRANAVDSG